MSLRWLLWSLLSPSQLILLSIALGIALFALGRKRGARVLLLVGGSGLVVFGVLPTSIYLANALETRFPQPVLPDRVDGIVLLAGSERPAASQAYGEPQVGGSGGRYVTTLRLAERYPRARIIYSGGPRRVPGKGPLETQAAVAERILTTTGALEPGRVRFEERSQDTCASGRNARVLAQPKPGEVWVVVTSAMHMPRTMACFRAAGWPTIIPQPADYDSVLGGWNAGSIRIASNLELLDEAAHEWLGLAYYRLSGRTQELFPAPRRRIDPPQAGP